MDWFLYDIGLRHERVKNVNRKRCKTFNFTCSFNDDFRTAVKNVSNSLLVRLFFGADIRIFHANKSLMLLGKCLFLVHFFLLGFYVHSHVFPHFFLSLQYILLHMDIYLCISQEGCAFLLLTINSDFTFLVNHLIVILQR